MTAQPRRYLVRARHAVAGSLIAAASLTGFTTVPAVAAVPTVVRPQNDDVPGSAGNDASGSAGKDAPVPPGRDGSGPAGKGRVGFPDSPVERLTGVRADLESAVNMRLVTREQADQFYAQIERRIRSGR